MRAFALMAWAVAAPTVAIRGAWEFRSGSGLTFEDDRRNNAYDAGREIAHLATFRRYDDCA